MAITRYSHQRNAIIQFLQSRKDHPTADVIYTQLRKTYPNLSLGTVYRNLTQLSDAGVILKISCNDSSDHYDGCVLPHGHFVCNCCHCVLDLDIHIDQLTSLIAGQSFEGEIETSQLIFYGKCRNCKQK